MYQPKTPQYSERIGMIKRLKRDNLENIALKAKNCISIALLSIIIGLYVSESVKLVDRTIEYYQTRPRAEIQESAKEYLNYIQNN